ncbi:zf-HC2 domain-containing protein [Bacillus weihaiensis]|uniref:zf-HC2 domain-containing protein n=1 Tax=Bacillus weihaiensis TaxID=1547283 RepID=UPI00235522E6|nr:zf-HC2 domain-containing protein [Bacillus weihaiensis]
MTVTCNIIRDVLPLYLENMCSDDSSKMIEEHVAHCQDCQIYLKEMKNSHEMPPIDMDMSPFRKIKSTLRRKKFLTVIFSMMLSIIVVMITIAFLTAPEYIPFSENSVEIKQIDNGSVIASFDDSVSGYKISSYPADDNSGYIYDITTWDSIWHKYITKSRTNNTILNPNNERVAAVYYYQTNGSENALIYGKDRLLNGGSVTLPRLVLPYYAWIAFTLVVIGALLMTLFRTHKKAFNLTMKIVLLPVSYLMGHFLIKGLSPTSYNATRDFYAILLVMIPVYIALVTGTRLVKEYNKKRNEHR